MAVKSSKFTDILGELELAVEAADALHQALSATLTKNAAARKAADAARDQAHADAKASDDAAQSAYDAAAQKVQQLQNSASGHIATLLPSTGRIRQV